MDKADYTTMGHQRFIDDETRRIAEILHEKALTYKDSWLRRGGVGASMMLLRKTDRLENILKQHGYDVFKAVHHGEGDPLDDIEDLAGYAILILAEIAYREYRERLAKIDSTGMAEPFGYQHELETTDGS